MPTHPTGGSRVSTPGTAPHTFHAHKAFPALSKPHLSRLGKKNKSQLGHRDGSSASLQPPPCPQTCQRQISKPRAITHRLCSDKRETAPGSFPCNQRQLGGVTGGGDSRDRGAGDVTSPPRHVGSRGCRWAGSVAPSLQHRERRHAAAAQLGERDKVTQGSQGGKTVFKRQGSPQKGLGLKAWGVFAAMNNPGAAARGLLPVPCSRRCSREGGWRWGRDPNPQLSPLDVPTPAAPQLA